MAIDKCILDVNHGGTGVGNPVTESNITVARSNLANYASRVNTDSNIGSTNSPIYIDDLGNMVVATEATSLLSTYGNIYVTNASELITALSTGTEGGSVIINGDITGDNITIDVVNEVTSIVATPNSSISGISFNLTNSNAYISDISLTNGSISNATNVIRCKINNNNNLSGFINCNKLYSCEANVRTGDNDSSIAYNDTDLDVNDQSIYAFINCNELFACSGDSFNNCKYIMSKLPDKVDISSPSYLDINYIPKIIDGSTIVANASYASHIGTNGASDQSIGDINTPVYVNSLGEVTPVDYNLANITNDINTINTSLTNIDTNKFSVINQTETGDVVASVSQNTTANQIDVIRVNASDLNVQNANYSTHIGTNSSHPNIGDLDNPVYVNSDGSIQIASNVNTRISELEVNKVSSINNGTSFDVITSISINDNHNIIDVNGTNFSEMTVENANNATNSAYVINNSTNIGDADNPVYISNGIPLVANGISTNLSEAQSTISNIIDGSQIIGVADLANKANNAVTLINSITNNPINVGSSISPVFINNGIPEVASNVTDVVNLVENATNTGGSDSANKLVKLTDAGKLDLSVLPTEVMTFRGIVDSNDIDPSGTTPPNIASYIETKLPNPISGDFFIAGEPYSGQEVTFTYDNENYYNGDRIVYYVDDTVSPVIHKWKREANSNRVTSVQGKIGSIELNFNGSGTDSIALNVSGDETATFTINNVANSSYSDDGALANVANYSKQLIDSINGSKFINISINNPETNISNFGYLAIANTDTDTITIANYDTIRRFLNISNVNNTADENKAVNIANLATNAIKLVNPNGTTVNSGNATNPVYIENGSVVNCTYTLGTNVPSDTVFMNSTPSIELNGSNVAINVNGAIGSEVLIPYAETTSYTYNNTTNGAILFSDSISSNSGLMHDDILRYNASTATLNSTNINSNLVTTNSLIINGYEFSIRNE